MTCNTVFIVRHGENVANVTREFSCRRIDYSLTQNGISQARETAAYFAQQHIDAIYSSPLKRAVETAAILAEPLHLPVSLAEDFREVDVGDLEGFPTPEHWELHDRIFQRWLHAGDAEAAFPGGESQKHLIARMRRGLSSILDERDGQRILIVAHRGILVATIAAVCTESRYVDLVPPVVANCAITAIEVEQRDGGDLVGKLLQWANASHLTTLTTPTLTQPS